MSLPYGSYRDSEIDWLGKVPEHWEVTRLKRACSVFPSNVDKHSHETEKPVLLCNYTDVYYRDVITGDIDFMVATASAEEIAKFTLRAGDVVFTKDSETADDIGIAAFVPTDLPGVLYGYHLSIARPRSGADAQYIKRVFDSHFAKAYFEVRANGLTRVGLGQAAVDNLPVPLPPLPEQKAIAAFLDRETGKIDALVEEQRRLIALLKEKRQAVISHAVTKGLDPAAPMKPSGIDWLGDIPAHWEVKRLKRIGEAIIGLTYAPDDVVGAEDGTLVLRSSNVQHGALAYDDCVYVSSEIPPRLRTRVGDILICSRNGSRALIGKNAMIDRSATGVTFGAFMTVFRSRANKFLQCVFNSPLFEYQSSAFLTSTINQLTVSNLYSFEVPLPPEGERECIADFLQVELSKLNLLVAEAEQAIALLQERRAALISAAVTGKIDVRGLVPEATEAA